MKAVLLSLFALPLCAQPRWHVDPSVHWHWSHDTVYRLFPLGKQSDAGIWRKVHELQYGPVRIGKTLPDDYWVARYCGRKVEGFVSSPMFPARDIASAQMQTECSDADINTNKGGNFILPPEMYGVLKCTDKIRLGGIEISPCLLTTEWGDH